MALGEVEGDLADTVHRDLGGAARGEGDPLAEDGDLAEHVGLGDRLLPRLAEGGGGDLLDLQQRQQGQARQMHLGLGERGAPLRLVGVGGGLRLGDLGVEHAERPAVVDAGEFGGQRRLLGALRRVDLVERDLQRDVDGLAEQRDVEAGAQDDRVRPPVVAGGVGRGGRGEGERRRDEQPGRRGGHQTARGHAEVGAVQDGETPTETWSRRGRTWGQAAADDVVAGIFTHSG